MVDPLVNAVIGPYVLRALISAGGVAEVYRAQHREDGRAYAVKIIRPERQADKLHHKAFLDEFALLQRLSHPGIPKGRRLDEVDGRCCMVMDLVPGTTLHQLRSDGTAFDAFDAFLQLTSIVAYLHEEALVHNDLKLENVMLRPDGTIALVDFGNAREVGVVTGIFRRLLARRAPVFGTPTYIAPELISGDGSPTRRSDLYSLGVCCFILLTGNPPFTHDRKSARLRAAVEETAPALRSRLPSMPQALARVIDVCLSKDPMNRLEDAGQLLHALKVHAKAMTRHPTGVAPIKT